MITVKTTTLAANETSRRGNGRRLRSWYDRGTWEEVVFHIRVTTPLTRSFALELFNSALQNLTRPLEGLL